MIYAIWVPSTFRFPWHLVRLVYISWISLIFAEAMTKGFQKVLLRHSHALLGLKQNMQGSPKPFLNQFHRVSQFRISKPSVYQASPSISLNLVSFPFDVCVSNMPTMVEAIKTTANALVQVLTLLLQLVVHLLEGSAIEMEETAQNEMSLHLTQMMQELQTHRQVLESLVRHQHGRAHPRNVTASVSLSQPFEMSPNPNTGRAQSSHPSIHGGTPVPSVLEWDSEEEPFVLAPTGDVHDRVMPNPLHVVNQIASRPAPTTPIAVPALPGSTSTMAKASSPVIPMTQPQGLSIQEWGQHVIAWGRKHKGKRFCEVLKEDLGYYEWSRARYNSLPPDQQDFVRYCQVALSRYNLAEP